VTAYHTGRDEAHCGPPPAIDGYRGRRDTGAIAEAKTPMPAEGLLRELIPICSNNH
jgi:hypothetical protein